MDKNFLLIVGATFAGWVYVNARIAQALQRSERVGGPLAGLARSFTGGRAHKLVIPWDAAAYLGVFVFAVVALVVIGGGS